MAKGKKKTGRGRVVVGHALARLKVQRIPLRPGGFRGVVTKPPPIIEQVIAPWFKRKYPLGSLIEYLVYMWLWRVAHLTPKDGSAGSGRADTFGYQVPALGGRTAGGQVVDFVVNGPAPIALLVNGGYWHFGGLTRTLTASIRARQELQRIVGRAVMVWETPLRTELDGTMRKALLGIEEPAPGNLRV